MGTVDGVPTNDVTIIDGGDVHVDDVRVGCVLRQGGSSWIGAHRLEADVSMALGSCAGSSDFERMQDF